MLDPTPHLERFEGYPRACREFLWTIPDSFNIADAILSQHPDSVTRVALLEMRPGGLNTYTYGGLDYLSDKFATALSQKGIAQGDSVAVVLPQSAACLIAQLATLKLGAVVVLLSPALESSDVKSAINDSGARAVIIHHAHREKVASDISSRAAAFVVNKLKPEFDDTAPDFDFWREVFEAPADIALVETPANSPAFVFYYPNSEGRLVSATHNHASLIHQLPAFSMCHNFQLDEETTFWTPRDWASIDLALCSVYPALWHGWRVLACESPASGSNAWSILERCEVSHLCVSPSELDQLREWISANSSSVELKLRSIVCAGAVTTDVHNWTRESIEVSLGAFYCNAMAGSVAASCDVWFEARPGSEGRTVPGYAIAIVDERGNELPTQSKGRIAIRRTGQHQPVELSLNRPEEGLVAAPAWIISGDFGFKDEEGYLWLSS